MSNVSGITFYFLIKDTLHLKKKYLVNYFENNKILNLEAALLPDQED